MTKGDIDDLLSLRYGNPGILPVLQMLYPSLDYMNKTFHIDHIYPRSKFKTSNKELPSNYIGKQNYICNLQLLEGQENESKGTTNPDEWLEKEYDHDNVKIESYKKQNYISPNMTLKWADIDSFYNDREKNLRTALEKLLK